MDDIFRFLYVKPVEADLGHPQKSLTVIENSEADGNSNPVIAEPNETDHQLANDIQAVKREIARINAALVDLNKAELKSRSNLLKAVSVHQSDLFAKKLVTPVAVQGLTTVQSEKTAGAPLEAPKSVRDQANIIGPVAEFSIADLTKKTQSTLRRYIDDETISVDAAVLTNQLNTRLTTLRRNLPIGHVGHQVLIHDTAIFNLGYPTNSKCLEEDTGKSYCQLLRDLKPMQSQPSIKLLGEADYKVIRQKLIGYEATEIAFIKNLREGEGLTRSHRQLSRTIDFEETESVREVFEKNELAHSEKSEMSTQITKESERENDKNFAASLTASYGPVKVTANAGFSASSSSSNSTKSASEYAQEMTKKAEASLREINKEKRQRTSLNEVEVINTHTVANESGGPQVSIYRWLDAVYENNLVNLGKRAIFQMMVPSPAAAWVNFRSKQSSLGISVIKPLDPSENDTIPGLPPLKTYSDIDRTNYQSYLAPYMSAIRDFSPPPDEYHWVSASFAIKAAGPTEADHGTFKHTKTAWEQAIEIPDQYEALVAEICPLASGTHEPITYGLGSFINWGGSTNHIHHPLPGIKKEFKLAGKASGPGSMIVRLKCKLTQEAYDIWRISIYQKIRNAYSELLSIYNAKIEEARIGIELQAPGFSPSKNRTIERTEFKKWFLEAFLQTRFESWNAMKFAKTGEAEIDFQQQQSEDRIVAFANDAFEFHNGTYELHDYFWGNKAKHAKVALLTDTDPMHAAWLQAGYGTYRVTVKPGYEGAVFSFLETGIIPDIPTVEDPVFKEVLSNVSGQIYDPDAVPESTWTSKQGTTLVWLQNNDPDQQVDVL